MLKIKLLNFRSSLFIVEFCHYSFLLVFPLVYSFPLSLLRVFVLF